MPGHRARWAHAQPSITRTQRSTRPHAQRHDTKNSSSPTPPTLAYLTRHNAPADRHTGQEGGNAHTRTHA